MTDYNAMADDDFRNEIRTFVEREYPPHLRFILQRARWPEMKDWWAKLCERGWIAPNWPVEWRRISLHARKMMMYVEQFVPQALAPAPAQGISKDSALIMQF